MMSDRKTLPLAALAAALCLLLLAAGLGGWVRHAGELMLAYGEAGISWCL